MAYKSTGFTVLGVFHTTSIVDDLDWTRRFYRTVFGTTSITLPFDNGRYASMSFIADTGLDTMVAAKYHESPIRRLRISNGQHWAFPCLVIDDTQDFIYRMRSAYGYEVNGWKAQDPVRSALQASPPGGDTRRLLFTHPWDTGIEWELYEVDHEVGESPAHQRLDPRWAPDWPPERDAGTAIECHAAHTIVVEDSTRAREFLVDICGGRQFHEAENPAFGTRSEFISLGERWTSTIELATPVADGSARRDLALVGNTYHCLNFKVTDLSRVRQNFGALDIDFEVDLPGHIVLNPDKCQGLRYGFVAELAPNDPRGRQV